MHIFLIFYSFSKQDRISKLEECLKLQLTDSAFQTGNLWTGINPYFNTDEFQKAMLKFSVEETKISLCFIGKKGLIYNKIVWNELEKRIRILSNHWN